MVYSHFYHLNSVSCVFSLMLFFFSFLRNEDSLSRVEQMMPAAFLSSADSLKMEVRKIILKGSHKSSAMWFAFVSSQFHFSLCLPVYFCFINVKNYSLCLLVLKFHILSFFFHLFIFFPPPPPFFKTSYFYLSFTRDFGSQRFTLFLSLSSSISITHSPLFCSKKKVLQYNSHAPYCSLE